MKTMFMEMIYLYLFSLCVFYDAGVSARSRETCYKAMANSRFPFAFKTFRRDTAIACCRTCTRKRLCDLVAYNKQTRRCELSSLGVGDESHIKTDNAWRIYFNTANECRSNPCKNSAVCRDGIGYYSCTCTSGWKGKNCDEDIDECHLGTDECEHFCSNTAGSYTCSCLVGYYLEANGRSCNAILNPLD